MLSSTGEYALRAVVYLSDKEGASFSSADIARATKVPSGYMSKILGDLARHDIVLTQRGPGGGCSLTREAQDLTVYDVLLAVDPPKRIHTCPLKLVEHGANLCPLHRRMDDVMLQIENTFRATTIAEIMQDTIGKKDCSFPLGRKQQGKNKAE